MYLGIYLDLPLIPAYPRNPCNISMRAVSADRQSPIQELTDIGNYPCKKRWATRGLMQCFAADQRTHLNPPKLIPHPHNPHNPRNPRSTQDRTRSPLSQSMIQFGNSTLLSLAARIICSSRIRFSISLTNQVGKSKMTQGLACLQLGRSRYKVPYVTQQPSQEIVRCDAQHVHVDETSISLRGII